MRRGGTSIGRAWRGGREAIHLEFGCAYIHEELGWLPGGRVALREGRRRCALPQLTQDETLLTDARLEE